MKLHHFVNKATDPENRARGIGKALVSTKPAPVTEIKLTDIKKVDTKPLPRGGETDKTEEMRSYAVNQLAGSSSAYNAHHKIRHYD